MSKEDVLLFGCYGIRGEGKSYYEILKEKEIEASKKYKLIKIRVPVKRRITLIDLLNRISNNEIEPPLYFRINTSGHNFIIKYLYFDFVIEDVKSSFNKVIFKKGEKFDMILSSLNKTIEIIDKGSDKQ